MSEEVVQAVAYDSDIDAIISERDELRNRVAELQKKLDAPTPCALCGRDNKLSPIKVKEEVKQKYFRSMLGQVPFTHTITALDGQLSATFMMQRGDVLLAKYKEGEKDAENNVKSMIASTLMNVKVIDKTTEIERTIYNKSADALIAGITNTNDTYEELLKSLDIVQLAFVRVACDTFALLVGQLISEINSEDFFKGAGLL